MNLTISIIDYGAGNIGSIVNMIRKLGGKAELVSTPEQVRAASKLILPGVGHFDFGMKTLNGSGLVEPVNEAVLHRGVPILGICLGAQLMTRSSEEGVLPGLGWFDAEVKSFRDTWQKPGVVKSDVDVTRLKTPHMGWNYVFPTSSNSLLANLPEESRFYFVHSYFIESHRAEEVLLTSTYGLTFASGLHRDNIYAVQFHPEKSHSFGLKLFQNYLNL